MCDSGSCSRTGTFVYTTHACTVYSYMHSHCCYCYCTICYASTLLLLLLHVSSLITRDLDHLDTEGFLTYLPTLTNGIMGFFIVEDALMRKVDHKEGLLSPQQASHFVLVYVMHSAETHIMLTLLYDSLHICTTATATTAAALLQQVETAWRRCQASLRDLIEHHVTGLSRPGHFLQLKENLLAMAKLAADLDLDRRPLMELLRKVTRQQRLTIFDRYS
jgi:hypothetical protein